MNGKPRINTNRHELTLKESPREPMRVAVMDAGPMRSSRMGMVATMAVAAMAAPMIVLDPPRYDFEKDRRVAEQLMAEADEKQKRKQARREEERRKTLQKLGRI